MEDLHILQTVEEFQGNMQKASNALGLSISSLYRRLSKIRSIAMGTSQDCA
jgi:transcriptional regulator of acetoin/glycerol metabolism